MRKWVGGMILVGLALTGPATASELPWGVGEECVFRIGYGPISAGEASLRVESRTEYYGHPVYHIRTRARSNRFFSTFFKVRDQADSYVDADSLFSRYFSKHLREGSYERDVEIHFDHPGRKAYFPDGGENDIPYGVQDVLSAFFKVRTLNLVDGAEFAIPTHGDKKLYDLRVRVLRREVRDTILGEQRCVVVQPILGDEGLFKHEGDLFVWLTDDERRIPVLVQANIPVGAIEARLTRYTAPTGEDS